MLGLDFQPEHYDLVYGQSGAKFRAIPLLTGSLLTMWT